MLRQIVVPLLSALLLAGCASPDMVSPANRSLAAKDADLAETASDQVDRLIASMTDCKVACGKGDTILYATLSPIDDLNTSSRFGRIYAEHAADRLVQRGYNVGELRMRESMSIGQAGEFVLSRKVQDLVKERQAAAILAGTYAVGDDHVELSLRLLDATTGRIVAASGTKLPAGPNVIAMLNGTDGIASAGVDRAKLIIVTDILSSVSSQREADDLAVQVCGSRGQIPVTLDYRAQFRVSYRYYDCAPVQAPVDPVDMK